MVMGVGKQMVDDLNLLFLGPIESGQIRQHFKSETLRGSQKTADFNDMLFFDVQVRLEHIVLEVADFAGKKFFAATRRFLWLPWSNLKLRLHRLRLQAP